MRDKRIISDIRKRDEKTFEYVVDKYSKLVWKVVASILINTSSSCEVEECVADVFIHLWEHPEKFDPEKGKLSSWLSMIARSRAIDRFRKLLNEKQVSFDDVFLLQKEELSIDNDDRVDKLKECINKLGSEEREIIIRRFFYEQKNREIAMAMEMKPKQIENHIYNAKMKLRKMMGEQ